MDVQLRVVVAGVVLEERRDHPAVDIPPIAVKVTEHPLIERRCGCGTVTAGQAPEGVGAPTQYGPRIAAIMVYLHVGHFLSHARTATALAELFGTPVSAGTVAAMTARAAGGLDGFLGLVRDRIAAAGGGALRRDGAARGRGSCGGCTRRRPVSTP